ncbi:hypothetical protein [Streptomyces sp. PA5.6]|uniref:hypothetical protein n=1 Tax=Streptomyces sp. PA5.6 TaxID=3035651 RepID=UPI003904C6DE
MLLPNTPLTRLRSADQPEQFQLPGDRVLARWVAPGARIELLPTPYDPDLALENWGPLTDCRAAVWRIDAHTLLTRVQFSAGLPEGVVGGYDGGQALAAITVEDRGTRLPLGGADEEAICRAADWGEVPRRWAGLVDEVDDHSSSTWGVDYGHYHGMSWTLPPLQAGDHCELPLVAAWAPATDDCANTWYAVMASPTLLLSQVTRAERWTQGSARQRQQLPLHI